MEGTRKDLPWTTGSHSFSGMGNLSTTQAATMGPTLRWILSSCSTDEAVGPPPMAAAMTACVGRAGKGVVVRLGGFCFMFGLGGGWVLEGTVICGSRRRREVWKEAWRWKEKNTKLTAIIQLCPRLERADHGGDKLAKSAAVVPVRLPAVSVAAASSAAAGGVLGYAGAAEDGGGRRFGSLPWAFVLLGGDHFLVGLAGGGWLVGWCF